MVWEKLTVEDFLRKVISQVLFFHLL